jgi:hypothetical protein
LLPELLSAVVSDGVSLASQPGGAVAGFAFSAALSGLFERRMAKAREILLKELRLGEKRLPPAQIDEGVAIVYRYFRAAQEGAARLNLRLMAQTVAGQARLESLSADEFLRDADMIASLRREEVFLLAKLFHAWNSDWLSKEQEGFQMESAMAWVAAELVPSVFHDRDEVDATAAAITRTGLLKIMPAIGASVYMPTVLLNKLMSKCDLEAALKKEGLVQQ